VEFCTFYSSPKFLSPRILFPFWGALIYIEMPGVVKQKKSPTFGSRIKFPIKIPLPRPPFERNALNCCDTKGMCISCIDLDSLSLWCLSSWDFTAGFHIKYRGVHSFYFEAISLRRRLLIPRSGQIGNCCRSRGMKESQINGLRIPVREIKLILRSHSPFLYAME
jgi:hypothetical protein